MDRIAAEGTHYEIGRKCGAAFSGSIRRILAELDISHRFDKACHDLLRHRLERNLARHAPYLLEQMKGIAHGSGIPLEHILTYNFLEEMSQLGCTVVGFSDTPEGPIVGKTNDIGQGKEHYHAAQWFKFQGGRRALIFAPPGTVWANAGVNDDGFCTAGASVRSEAVDMEGIPSQMVQRILLEKCSSVSDALRLLTKTNIMCSPLNLILADARGQIVIVEKDVYAQALRHPERGTLFATNHWTTSELSQNCTASPERMQNSRSRFRKLDRLTREVPHTVEGMKAILRDHTRPGAICQHGEDGAGMHTTAAYVIVPRQRTILFSYGPPCRAEFQLFEL